ncbi:MAG: M23 family metallopeptidase, partial [bacterium]
MPVRFLLVFSAILLSAASFGNSGLVEMRGEWVQGGLLVGKVPAGYSVSFMGKEPRIGSDGTFVVGLGRDAPQSVDLVVRHQGSEGVISYPVKSRTYQEQRVEGVPQKTVTPPPEVSERIAREAALVAKVRTRNDSRADFLEGFQLPAKGPITGVYGSRRVYNGIPKSPHYGLDIAGPTGTPVKAPAPGIVTLVQNDLYYSGGTLIIDHGHGLSSTYLHLSKILVREGDRVDPSTTVAEIGASGRASGAHLDWRMNWFDVRIDPEVVLRNFP